MDSQEATVPGRMYELDWLRVIVSGESVPTTNSCNPPGVTRV